VPLSKPPQFLVDANANAKRGESPVQAHLRLHEVRCPECGYNLHRATGPACPECGCPIDARILWPDRYRPALYAAAAGHIAGAAAMLALAGEGVAHLLSPGPVQRPWYDFALLVVCPALAAVLATFAAWTLLRQPGQERFRQLPPHRRVNAAALAWVLTILAVAAQGTLRSWVG
jgi:hypothetical protein